MTALWSQAKQERMTKWGKADFSLGGNHILYLELHRSMGQQSLIPKLGLPVTVTAQISEGCIEMRRESWKESYLLLSYYCHKWQDFLFLYLRDLSRLLFTLQSQKQSEHHLQLSKKAEKLMTKN